MDAQRVAIVGPGSVGCFFAAHLATTRHEVVACARRPFERYVVDSSESPVQTAANVVINPAQLDPPAFDWVLVGVKAHQTAGAAPWFERVCGPDTIVVAMQNGIEAVERLEPYVNGARVLASVVYCGAELVEPGHIEHRRSGRLIVPDNAEGRELLELFENTPVIIDPTDRHRLSAWVKLSLNVVVNGLTALTGQPMSVLSNSYLAQVAAELLREVLVVGRAEGADLELDGVDETIANLAKAGGGRSSMLQDVEVGRPTEHDAIHGAVMRAGRRHDIATPYCDTIHALLDARSV